MICFSSLLHHLAKMSFRSTQSISSLIALEHLFNLFQSTFWMKVCYFCSLKQRLFCYSTRLKPVSTEEQLPYFLVQCFYLTLALCFGFVFYRTIFFNFVSQSAYFYMSLMVVLVIPLFGKLARPGFHLPNCKWCMMGCSKNTKKNTIVLWIYHNPLNMQRRVADQQS